MTGSQQNTELIIYVTHVEAENQFLKIWGQIDKNTATYVERLIHPLIPHFVRGMGCPGPQSTNLVPNAICCAKFQNDGYFRARICNVRSDGMVAVHFIDYGNVDVLSPRDVHLLDEIPGTEPLRALAPVAFSFTLANVLPINNTWENNTIDTIKKILWYNEYKAVIVSRIEGHYFIQLNHNNEDFVQLLVKKQMAVAVSTQEMFRPKSIQAPEVPMYHQQPPRKESTPNKYLSAPPAQHVPANPMQRQVHNAQGTWQNVAPTYSVPSKQQLQPLVQEALVFKSRVLDIGSTHDVRVSHVEDGPLKFSIQLEVLTETLTKLMREINSQPTQPLQEPPLPGAVCLGRYTEGKVLCRAVVMSVMDDKCKLYYVDFGFTEVLPYRDIYQLPPQYINPKVLSIRLTLSGLRDLKVTDDMKTFFKEYVAKKHLVLHVRPPEGPPLIQYGDLYDNGKNVKDILGEHFPAIITYQSPNQLMKGSEEIVHVSYVESCRKFFVQLDSMVPALDSVMNVLAEYGSSTPPLNPTKISVGMPCIALYENQWYRAKVININGDSMRVLYVDYGNEETINVAALRHIHTDLVKKLPAQAIKCVWNGSETIPNTREYTRHFETLVMEKRLHMRVINVTPDGLLVGLQDPEKMENIRSQLIHTISATNTVTPALNQNDEETENYSKMSSQKNMQSDNTNKWNQKKQTEQWRQPSYEETSSNTRSPKSWKEGINEEKQRDNRYEMKSFGKRDKENFGGKGRSPGNESRFNRSGGSDKSWSDKDSDTSSRGSGRRGRGNNNYRGGRGGRRENTNGRNQWNDRDNNSGREAFPGKGQSNEKDNKGRMATARGSQWNDRSNNRNSYRRDSSGKDSGSEHSFGNQKPRGRKNENNGVYKKAPVVESWDTSNTNGLAVDDISMQTGKSSKKSIVISSQNISVGSVKTCEVVYANGPSDFYVQISPDYLELEKIMEQIALEYENNENQLQSSEVESGMHCIAQYSEDLRWYRAVIESINGSTASVRFIDYGNVENVAFDKIRELKDEFSKLPVQAVHCKLFGSSKTQWDQAEIDDFKNKTEGIAMQGEFVTKKDSVYEILLREIVEAVPASTYINEQFCEGIDLEKAKECAKNTTNSNDNASQMTAPDYVPSDFSWAVATCELGSKESVFVSWYVDPSDFYCQVQGRQSEFRNMMFEIQKLYKTRKPIIGRLEVGMPVIAFFSEDQALYRAEIVELTQTQQHVVQYVDFGNRALVDQVKIYPVEKKFTKLPKQAVRCCLKETYPKDTSGWSKEISQEAYTYFNSDEYECTFHDIQDDKYVISLRDNGCDIVETLISKGLAVRTESSKTVQPIEIEQIDINLLYGQTFKAQVSNVESTEKFYIRLPLAVKSDEIICEYMTDKDPKVMQRLPRGGVCPGTGCLVQTTGIWRRAVITSCSGPTSLEVRYIDTGAYDEIPLDNVLALPAQLSGIQKQAIECCVQNAPSSPDVNEKLKDFAKQTEVILRVEEVDRNRLIVTLFDSLGERLKFSETDEGKVSPICPMPILSSTHKVTVSYAENSGSIWLQRNVDYDLDVELQKSLREYYGECRNSVEPIIGALCAAKSADGEWYRARIVNTAESGAYVNFIDYGNTELIALDALKELDAQFYVPYELAVHVALSVRLKGTDGEQVASLQSQLLNRELSAVFYNVHKKWIVELLDNGEKLSEKFCTLGLVASSDDASEVGESRDVDMVVGKRYKVVVSHADSPSQFWLQRIDEIAILEEKQSELQSNAESFPVIEGVPEEGSLCAAVYSIDNLWYRAEVLDADEDITTVRFIDYGNTDVINNKAEKIRKLPEEWASFKRYATKCRLDIIPIDSEDWDESTCEKFETVANSVDCLNASIISDGSPKRVDLFVQDKSISQTLVDENHATLVHAEGDVIDEIVDLELDPHSAFVSHVNSPNEFWVQEEKSVAALEVLTDRFIIADMFPKVSDVKEGMLCVAKFPEDGHWYRARIMSQGDGGVQVLYIDYGNSATSTEIREIPDDLADTPPLSRKCCLVLPEGVKEWSQEACVEFSNLAADGATIFLLEVLKEQETSLVKLCLNGDDVANLLAAYCERQLPTIEERLPPLGEENSPNILISNINSPDEFWIQAEEKIGELELMSERLEGAQSFVQLEKIEVGTICAAKFPDDGHWYRAKILSHEEGNIRVLYIDYGNSATSEELKVLPEDIVNIPSLSKRCTLQLPEGVSSWPEEACAKFKELAADGATMFQFEVLKDAEVMRISLSLNGKDVADILSSACEKEIEVNDQPTVDKTQSDEATPAAEASQQELPEDTPEVLEMTTSDDLRENNEAESSKLNESSNSQTSCEIIYDSRVDKMQPPIENEDQAHDTVKLTEEATTKFDALVDSVSNLMIQSTSENVTAADPTLLTDAVAQDKATESAESAKTDEPLQENAETEQTVEVVPELSVDDIVQSMIKNTMDEVEVNSSADSAIESHNSDSFKAEVKVKDKDNEDDHDEVCSAVDTDPNTQEKPNAKETNPDANADKETTSDANADKETSPDANVDKETSSDANADKENTTKESISLEEKTVAHDAIEKTKVECSPNVPVETKNISSESSQGDSIHIDSSVEEARSSTPNLNDNHKDTIVKEDMNKEESSNLSSSCPTTPKITHSEKLVAGAVNPQPGDEILIVFEQPENIPTDER